MIRSPFLRSLALAALTTASAGMTGCAEGVAVDGAAVDAPADVPAIAPKFNARTFVETGLSLLSHVSLVNSTFGALVGLDIWGGSDPATLSEDTIEDIADAVGQRLDARLLVRDRTTAESVFRAEREYSAPSCFEDGACSAEDVRLVREDWSNTDGLVWQANRLIDQMMKPENGHSRLQVAQHVQRLGSTAIFGYYQLAAAARVHNDDRSLMERHMRNAGDRAGEILGHLDTLQNEIYPAYVSAQFSDIDWDRNTMGARRSWVEGCFTGPHLDEPDCIWREVRYNHDRTRNEIRAELDARRAEGERNVRSWWFPGVFGQDYFTVRYQLERIVGEVEHLGGGAEPVDIEECEGNSISANSGLIFGESRRSCNGEYTLVHRRDGNVVVTGPRGGVVWETGTAGNSTFFLYLYGTGYLALLDSGFRPIWRVRDAEGIGDSVRLVVRDNGELVLVDGLGYVHWTAEPGEEVVPPAVRVGGRVALRGAHGLYFVAEHSGEMNADRGRIGSLEQFTVLDRHSWANGQALRFGDTLSLQGGQRRFVVSEHDGALNANRPTVGSLERFVIVDPDGRTGEVPCGATVAIRTAQGTYITAEADGTAQAGSRDINADALIEIICR